MNALDPPDAGHGPIDLAALASPAVLMEPARLYATVSDDAGMASPWRFLADLPAGSAVFALAAPGASFLLTARTSAIAPQLDTVAARRRRHRRLVCGVAVLSRRAARRWRGPAARSRASVAIWLPAAG